MNLNRVINADCRESQVMTTATAVRERPILFSGPMVQAILAGRKSQTRRIVKPQPELRQMQGETWFWEEKLGALLLDKMPKYCPYGRPGDRVYVQENYALSFIGDVTPAYEAGTGCMVVCRYLADGAERTVSLTAADVQKLEQRKSDRHKPQPGRFMFRSCSRLTLELTEVRCERVQDISAKDIIAEGAVLRSHDCAAFAAIGENPKCPVSAFDGCAYPDLRSLWAAGWEKVNGKGAWHRNDWVWALSFRIVTTGSKQ